MDISELVEIFCKEFYGELSPEFVEFVIVYKSKSGEKCERRAEHIREYLRRESSNRKVEDRVRVRDYLKLWSKQNE